MKHENEDQKTEQLIHFLVEDRYRLGRHAIFNLSLLVILYYSHFSNSYSGVYKYYSTLTSYTVFTTMFYTNMYLLVPIFFFRGRYVLYLFLFMVVIASGLASISYITDGFLDEYRLAGRPKQIEGFYEGAVISVCVVLVTTTIKLFQRWARDNERIAELKNLALRMELSELRNQINPHFLFNMLNNVKALIRIDPAMATSVIVKLSEFLRFQLYENVDDNTLLSSELNFLSNFINLERMRRDNFTVGIGTNIDQQLQNKIFVPPNLFIMFVENAIKHSVDPTEKGSYVKIHFDLKDDGLHFHCVNSVSPLHRIYDYKNSGVGMANAKRRLELLYQDRFSLRILQEEDTYTVDLIIPT